MSQELSHQQLKYLGDTYGTPLYVYNAPQIAVQYKRLTSAFADSNTHIYYACKALTNLSVLRYMKALGAKIDCSSINEVKLALHAGFMSAEILYTSNGIAFAEIQEAKELGVKINIDSISNLQKFAALYKNEYKVGVRLRPNIMAGGNLKISTGHDKSKFGIPLEQLDEVLAIQEQYDLQISTLHIHTGSEIKDVEVFVKGMNVLFDILPNFKNLEAIDLGGGFKVKYQQDDQVTDIELLAKEVTAAFAAHPLAKDLQIWFEPGKFLVSECGYLITSVNVIKENPSVTLAGVDSGFNHLIRPMFYEAYHEILNVSNPEGKQNIYTIVGNICETDTFATDRSVPEIREGDYLVFKNAGAYGFEMSSNFNSRYKPAEVMVEGENSKLVRRRDSWEDLIRNQS